ncbi:hypothetical protein BC567DRAFT_206237 [Phyllosticta citribraziliensis]
MATRLCKSQWCESVEDLLDAGDFLMEHRTQGELQQDDELIVGGQNQTQRPLSFGRVQSEPLPPSPNRDLEPVHGYAKAAPYESNILAPMDPIIWTIILGVCEGTLRENLQGTFEEVMARAAELPRKVHRLFFFQPRIGHTQEQTHQRWVRWLLIKLLYVTLGWTYLSVGPGEKPKVVQLVPCRLVALVSAGLSLAAAISLEREDEEQDEEEEDEEEEQEEEEQEEEEQEEEQENGEEEEEEEDNVDEKADDNGEKDDDEDEDEDEDNDDDGDDDDEDDDDEDEDDEDNEDNEALELLEDSNEEYLCIFSIIIIGVAYVR